LSPLLFTRQTNKALLKRYSGIILLALLVAFAFSPIKVPYTLESMAKVMPAQQYILTKLPDGALTVTFHDHLGGQMKEAEGYQFDRGDLVKMHFGSADTVRTYAREGEIMAAITSNRLDEQIVALRNELRVEQANLGVVATGEKDELIRQRKQELNLAKENLKIQKKLFDRAKLLVEELVISQQEYELAENAHEAAILQVKVAEEALEVAETGEKVETVDLASSRIEALKQQIAFLEDKQTRYLLYAPFSGPVRSETTIEWERILLEDTTAFVLFIPVKVRDSRFVQAGQEIAITLPDNQQTFSCQVLEVGSQVILLGLGLEQVVTVKAITYEKNLPYGMPLRCTINCGNVRITEFLRRAIQWK
jgi:hypothetical protein